MGGGVMVIHGPEPPRDVVGMMHTRDIYFSLGVDSRVVGERGGSGSQESEVGFVWGWDVDGGVEAR